MPRKGSKTPAKPRRRKLLGAHEARRIEDTLKTDPVAAARQLRATIAVKRGVAVARNTRYSIDAIRTTPKRRRPERTTGSVDQEFAQGGPISHDRLTMIATARDLFFNFSFAKGILRQHVKHVYRGGPILQSRSGDPEFDKRSEEYFGRWAQKCDIRGILFFRRFLKVSEARELVDGDCGIVLAKNTKLQGIEADRIADPPGDQKKRGRKYSEGVEMNKEGRPVAYHVHKRGRFAGSPGTWQARYEAKDFVYCIQPERFSQVRGVTWPVSALTDMRDLQETMEAVKGKAKLENLLGVVTKSQSPSLDDQSLWGGLTPYDETDMEGQDEERSEVKLGQGLYSWELQPGEEIQVVESKTPNKEMAEHILTLIRWIALTLEMPLEIALQFFTRGSYSAHRAAVLEYDASIKERRFEIKNFRLDRIHRWVISRALKAEELDPPKEWDPDDPFHSKHNPWAHVWQWGGVPLLDPDKERKADTLSYKLGIESLADICARNGSYWQDVARQRISEVKWIIAEANKEGVDPNLVLPQVMAPGQKTAAAAGGARNAGRGAQGEG
jgi:capsid protein